MVKRVCDRCGEDVSNYYTMKVIRGAPMLAAEVCDYDLCDECWDDFMKFMEQKSQLKQEEK